MSASSVEREARFLVRDEPARLALIRLRALDGFRRIRVYQERQRNTYLDTRDFRLRRARSVLKLRQVGTRTDLTYKRSRGLRRGVAERLEVTARIRRSQIHQALSGRLTLAPMRRVQMVVGDLPLEPLFTLFTHRYGLIFSDGRFRVEVDVDRVTLRRGRRVRAHRLEVEVENLSAPPAAFARAVAALARRFGKAVRPTTVSKFEYGLRLTRRRGRSSPAYV